MSASSLAIQNSIQLYGGQSLPNIGSGDIAQLQSTAQAYLDDNTTTAANDGRISNGAAAAASIIQNGYNPDNADDNQKLVVTIAGGCSLIPGVGPVLGAVIIGMYEIGTQVIAPLVDKLLGYSSIPTCSSSGNWTTTGVLSNCGINSFPPAGTLAGLVVPALGKAYSQMMNCDAFNKVPGTIPFGFQLTIAPLLKMWNQATDGDLIDYFVPRINAYDWPGGTDTFFGNISCAAAPFCYSTQSQYAFQPLSQVPEWDSNGNHILDPTTEGASWMRVAANAGPLKSASPTTPRVVKLDLHYGGASATNPGSSITTSSSSTGATVVKGTAWTIAGLGVAGLLYGWAIGKGGDFVFSKIWEGGKKLFDRPVHVGESFGELREALNPAALLEDATSNPLLVGESRGTAVQTLLFSKKMFTVATAKRWASQHGYTSRKVHVTANKIRLRQHPPGQFRRERTEQFEPGVQGVIGWRK